MSADIHNLIQTCDLIPGEDTTRRLLDICALLDKRIERLEAARTKLELNQLTEQVGKIPLPDATECSFHAHLDECEQCRTRPFGLCAKGTELLLRQAPFNIVLTTENGDGPSNTICLEPCVLAALIKWLTEVLTEESSAKIVV